MSPQPVWGRGPGSGRHATGATPRGRAASAARLAAPSYARFRPVVATRRLTLPGSRAWRSVEAVGCVARAHARTCPTCSRDSVSIFTRYPVTRSREDPAPPDRDRRRGRAWRASRRRRDRTPACLAPSPLTQCHEYGYSSTDTPKWRRRSCEDVIGVEMKTLPVKTRVCRVSCVSRRRRGERENANRSGLCEGSRAGYSTP